MCPRTKLEKLFVRFDIYCTTKNSTLTEEDESAMIMDKVINDNKG